MRMSYSRLESPLHYKNVWLKMQSRLWHGSYKFLHKQISKRYTIEHDLDSCSCFLIRWHKKVQNRASLSVERVKLWTQRVDTRVWVWGMTEWSSTNVASRSCQISLVPFKKLFSVEEINLGFLGVQSSVQKKGPIKGCFRAQVSWIWTWL